MSEPVYGTATERIYDRLPDVLQRVDTRQDYALKKFLSSVTDRQSEIDALIARLSYTHPEDRRALLLQDYPVTIPGRPVPLGATSDLVDGRTADTAWLPWLAQLFGVNTRDVTDEQELRDAINSGSSGFRAGSRQAVIDAVKSALTGTRDVLLYPNSSMSYVKTNLVTNSLPTDNSNFRAGADSTGYMVDPDDGLGAIFAQRASAAPLLDPNINFGASHGLEVGRWIAMGVDVRPMDAPSATNMRLQVSAYNGATINNVGTNVIPVQQGRYTRIVQARQVTGLPAGGYIRLIVWPSNSSANEFRARRFVVAIGRSEAQARAMVQNYYTGSQTVLGPNIGGASPWNMLIVTRASETPKSAEYPVVVGQKTNYARDPLPTSALTDWTASPGETLDYVMDGGQPAARVTDAVGGGGPYLINTIPTSTGPVPTLGQYVGVALETRLSTASGFSSNRLSVRHMYGPTSSTDYRDTVTSTTTDLTTYQRLITVVQIQDVPISGYSDRIRVAAWPVGTAPAGASVYGRRLVVAYGATEADVRAQIATYFEGTQDIIEPGFVPIEKIVARKGAKPAGVVLHHTVFRTNWDNLEAALPTAADWDGKSWSTIEEVGL